MSLAPATGATASTVTGAIGLIGAGMAGDGADAPSLGLLPATGLATLSLAVAGVVLLIGGLALFRLSVRAQLRGTNSSGVSRAR